MNTPSLRKYQAAADKRRLTLIERRKAVSLSEAKDPHPAEAAKTPPAFGDNAKKQS
jgi:hypothetical protein